MYNIIGRRRFTALNWTSGFLLTLAMCLGVVGVCAANDPSTAALNVVVVAVQGEVNVATQGQPHTVHKDDVISLPATVFTGPSGSIELRQGPTTFSAAPNTRLDIPATANRGEAIDRVIQSQGNAFYSVGKRESHKLRVETPYLVAVIKGTQFSVTSLEDSTTISLFEGRLEVHASDESDLVDLKAGEIAIRHGGDTSIRVLRMDSGEPVARDDHSHAGDAPTTAQNGDVTATSLSGVGLDGGATGITSAVTDATTVVAATPSTPSVAVSSGTIADPTGKVSVSTGISAELPSVVSTASATVHTLASIAGTGVSTDSGVGTSVNAANLAAAGVSAANTTSVNLGTGSVSANTNAAANVGVANVTTATVTATNSTSANLGTGSVSTATGVSVGVGSTTASVGVAASTTPAATSVTATASVPAVAVVPAVSLAVTATVPSVSIPTATTTLAAVTTAPAVTVSAITAPVTTILTAPTTTVATPVGGLLNTVTGGTKGLLGHP